MARFLVPQPVAGFLIGSGGARMRSYCERSGAKVWVAGQQHDDVRGMRCGTAMQMLAFTSDPTLDFPHSFSSCSQLSSAFLPILDT
jgi:hypothetical protein